MENNKVKDYGLVSVIMPNYNGEKYLKETVESVLNQTYKNWELVFVDDCSKDNSLELIKSFQDERIKIFKNEKNSGAAKTRNKAIREAKGKWIAFLDSDDLWMPNKLEKQLAFMEENNYSFSYTKYELINEQSEPLKKIVTGPKKVTKSMMFSCCWVGCLTVIYNREKVGLVQIDESIAKRNDYALWLKVCKTCNCYLLNENLAKYRIRRGSVSHVNKKVLIKAHYRLFRVSENKSSFASCFYTLRNLFFVFFKKTFYSKKER